MLRRWDDSQRFLADMPQLISEDTANFLILWCIKLQREGVCSRLLFSPSSVLFLLNPQSFLVSVLQKEALMKQVAHQAVVMQFILELASHSKQDPRGCFRQFFYKAKVRRRPRNKYFFISCKLCTSTALYIRKVLQFNKYLSIYEIKTHLKVKVDEI